MPAGCGLSFFIHLVFLYLERWMMWKGLVETCRNNISQPQNMCCSHKGKIASLQHFVPATCPVKFNKLNSEKDVAGTKLPKILCCTSLKLSGHTREHVAATCPSGMYVLHFCVRVRNVSLSLRHIPATPHCYMSPLCEQLMIWWL